MGNSIIDEAVRVDSDEAYTCAKFTASQMVNALRRDYSDNIIKMAFEAVLNESCDELFQAIYESACQLREDGSGSFATYMLKLRPLLNGKPAKWYGAAAVYRFKSMAEDNIIVNNSCQNFLQSLRQSGLKDDEIFAGELYYNIRAAKGHIGKVRDLMSARANSLYDDYKNQNESGRNALLGSIKITWNTDTSKAPEKKSLIDKLLGK